MTIPSPSEFVKKYDLAAKKSLGQNFILDKNFTDKIAKSVNNLKDSFVLEVGPGPACLTRSILDLSPKKLVVVEKDKRFLPILNEISDFYPNKLEIINDDALKISEETIFKDIDQFKIVANLPYNIGCVLLIKWLKISSKISSMTLMLQKEVVDRIVAKPSSKHYGRLSVMTNFLYETKLVFNVSNSVFTPKPKVLSAIVELKLREKPLYENVNFLNLEKVVACAFNQRRKMIKSSIANLFEKPQDVLESLEINSSLRAENLDIIDFCKLSTILNK